MSLAGGIGAKSHGPANPGTNVGIGLPDWVVKNWWLLPAIIFGVLLLVPRTRESGHVVYEDAEGNLHDGPTVFGDPGAVSVPLKCPEGAKLVALYHTHPSGDLKPSEQDLATAKSLDLPVFIEAHGDVLGFSVKGASG